MNKSPPTCVHVYAVSIIWVKLLRDSQLLTCQLVPDLAVERLHTFCIKVAYIIVDYDFAIFIFSGSRNDRSRLASFFRTLGDGKYI